MCGFFKWARLSNCLDTFQEWHALVEGIADGFCRSRAHYEPYDKGSEDENLLDAIRKEHHYYNAGRAFGFALFIFFVAGMVLWVVLAIIKAI